MLIGRPLHNVGAALREESSQTNVILQYKLPAGIFSAVCSVINSHSMYFYLAGNYMMGNCHALDHISSTVFCATKQPAIQLPSAGGRDCFILNVHFPLQVHYTSILKLKFKHTYYYIHIIDYPLPSTYLKVPYMIIMHRCISQCWEM